MVPERGKSQITYTDNNFFLKIVERKMKIKSANPYSGGHTQTQTEMVPDRGKSWITYTKNYLLIKNIFR